LGLEKQRLRQVVKVAAYAAESSKLFVAAETKAFQPELCRKFVDVTDFRCGLHECCRQEGFGSDDDHITRPIWNSGFFFWFEAFDVYPFIVKVNYSCERRNMPRVALDMQVSGFLYNTTTKRISEL
jgi:hypothetical protein